MKSSNGKLMIGKKTILSLGALAKHDDGKPDYLKRLRESFSDGKPLIKELEPYVGQAPVRKWTVTFDRGDEKCIGEPKRLAPCVLDPVFRALGLDELFASVKCASRIRYDLTGIVRLLTYGRIIDPESKRSTMGQNEQYYAPLVKSTNPENVYDALDVICANRKQIVQRKMRQAVKPAKEDSKWSYGIPGARISDALAGWQVVEFPGEYYQMLKSKGDDIFAILKAFGMELKPQLYTRGEIREMKATAGITVVMTADHGNIESIG